MPRRKYSYIHQDLQKLARPIEELTPDPKNARTHGDRNMSAIRGSLKEFGFRGAIIAQKSGDELIVRAGNGRLEAARQLGWSHVPVLVYSDDDKTSAAFALADNRTAELAAWDFEQIAGLIKEGALDEEIDIGFSSEEIQRILDGEILPLGESESILDGEDAGEREGLTDPDEVPEAPEEPITKTGDLWILGDHRLLCGDSTKSDEVARLMDSEKADMVFTDPPYGISYKSNWRLPSESFEKIENDDRILTEWLPLASKFSTGFCFTWTTWKVLPQWMAVIEPWSPITNMVVWHKGKGGMGDLQRTYSPDYELALVCNRGAELTGKRIGSVWSILTDNMADYIHPTQKPVALAEQAIATTTRPGDIVLDFFGGSGSTMIACETLGRSCRMMEIDRGYCDVIVKRWEDFTGKKAHLSKK